MAERKVVGRKIAIVLGAVCIVLAVGLIIALVAYLPQNSQIGSLNAQKAQKDDTIASLNAQIASLNSQIQSQTSQNPSADVTALQNQIDSLNSQIRSMYNLLSLNASAILISNQTFTMEPNSNYTVWDQPDTPLLYAGYVVVQVQSSSNLMYVEMLYDSFGFPFDSTVTVQNGVAAFPVLPGPAVIVLGNTEPNATVTGTISATYHY
jgi:cell division protein FtsB